MVSPMGERPRIVASLDPYLQTPAHDRRSVIWWWQGHPEGATTLRALSGVLREEFYRCRRPRADPDAAVFSSSNQFSTTMMLSGDFVSSGRIIRNRLPSRDTAYCGVNRLDSYPAAGKSVVERPTENVRSAFTSTATRLPEASR